MNTYLIEPVKTGGWIVSSREDSYGDYEPAGIGNSPMEALAKVESVPSPARHMSTSEIAGLIVRAMQPREMVEKAGTSQRKVDAVVALRNIANVGLKEAKTEIEAAMLEWGR